MTTPGRLDAYDVVAFDGDDTLWHHERLFEDIAGRFREMLSHHVDGDTIDRLLFDTERRNLEIFGYGVKGYGFSLIETALEVTNNDISGDEVQLMIDWVKEMLADPIETLPGVNETVAALYGKVRLGIITKGDLFDQEGKIARSGLGELMDHIAIVSEKDEPTYRRVFSEWEVDPGRVLFLGNSVRSDVEPVFEAGGTAVHVPYYLEWEHERVESPNTDFLTLGGISEILDILR